jgi:hypothetical protein
VPKWLKFVLGIALVPLCIGAASALWLVIAASGSADRIWAGLLAGAGCWLAIYLLLPKPMWVYVVGHELTHVLWTWLMGGRVKRFRATSSGGHVVVTKSNFLIALAPYFFPLYAILLALAYTAGAHFWNWHPHAVWFHLLLGAAYAFHLTLTWHILQSRQTDITQQGYLFSGVVIFLGNVTVLLLGIPLLADQISVPTALALWRDCTWEFFRRLASLLGAG